MDALIAGTTDLAYDGQAFYATTHETGDSGTQSNLLTGTGTTLALLKDDFDSAIQAMMRFKNADGDPIHETDVNFRPLVITPTSLWGNFRDLQNAAIINNTTNTIRGVFDLVQSPRLDADDANDWYLADMGGIMKPFVQQTREALEFQSLVGDSDIGFIKEEYLWKIRWRGRVANAFWQKSTKTTNA
jgi:phage major head subunit gpT-like protein